MAKAINLGFPRIGGNRELKKALEAYWAGKLSAQELSAAAKEIRLSNWRMQSEAGIEQVPVGDFSFYDHVLDTAFTFDLIPERFRKLSSGSDLDLYFAMARGAAGTQAMEMTKWFDTNYHYIVPEIAGGEQFRLTRPTIVDSYSEAIQAGHPARPVLLSPVSFLLSGKTAGHSVDRFALLDGALEAYGELLRRLSHAGATWIQIDEPALALDLDAAARQAVVRTFERLSQAVPGLRILVATYFGPLLDNLDLALHLPVHSLHLDLVRGPEQLEPALRDAPRDLTLSLGLVDGRNIWKTDLASAFSLAEKAADRISCEQLFIAPSCSLLHVPVDLVSERYLSPEIRNWLAFGRQKLDEVVLLARGINEGRSAIAAELEANTAALAARRASKLVFDAAVRARMAAIEEKSLWRQSPHAERARQQQAVLELPPLPTTTIGSFPQTAELRRERLRMRKGEIPPVEYENFVRNEITQTIRSQEELQLDVLVHGEAERNDMVEYFGELLDGFVFTENGWVQSYGSRCVKPPIIYGDIVRPRPMTVWWWNFSRTQTSRPVKGMLTGPVTILQWSFVRDDQPRRDTCRQLGLVIRAESLDLEAAGCRIIQIDEPALREGLPLRAADAAEYLKWAVDCFRLASAAVKDSTQIHTHMCYADFNDIVDAVQAMDADVISLESARSRMETLDAFVRDRYSNDIGPGVYDIHSPRVPSKEEMVELLEKALQVVPAERLWVNPDCGLKTRRWEEVLPALKNMVAAAQEVRAKQTAD
ncbi:MAG TPA: 5-methyltetrahydropteroyltriglutamate--homocysteine S-methyltransferase [Bryobacteraceae bacterium]